VRGKEHYSELYFGASLSAFCHLADLKGYDFIGTTRAGVNAYFVRKDVSGPFRRYSASEGYNESHNRDSKDAKGKLQFLRHEKRLDVIKDLPVFNIETNKVELIKDTFK